MAAWIFKVLNSASGRGCTCSRGWSGRRRVTSRSGAWRASPQAPPTTRLYKVRRRDAPLSGDLCPDADYPVSPWSASERMHTNYLQWKMFPVNLIKLGSCHYVRLCNYAHYCGIYRIEFSLLHLYYMFVYYELNSATPDLRIRIESEL